MRTLVFLLLLLSSAARAENVGVVVTGEPTMQPQLVSQLESWLKKHGHELVPSPLPPDAVNTLIDCFVIEDEGCARGVIEKRSKAEAVVYARVDIQAGGDIEKTVTVTAYWFKKGEPAVAERRFCQRCTEQTLRSTADEIVEALAKAGQKKSMGKLELTSTPKGATVMVDGKPVGITPIEHHVVPGPHEITVSYAGHDTETRFVEVKLGEITQVDVPLAPSSAPKSRLLPILTMAAGGALVATGAIFIAIDEDEEFNDQEKIYDTASYGVVYGIAGVAAIAGGYLWYRKLSRRESAPVATITSGGAYVGWMGRF